jgi:hypothetical protein
MIIRWPLGDQVFEIEQQYEGMPVRASEDSYRTYLQVMELMDKVYAKDPVKAETEQLRLSELVLRNRFLTPDEAVKIVKAQPSEPFDDTSVRFKTPASVARAAYREILHEIWADPLEDMDDPDPPESGPSPQKRGTLERYKSKKNR